MIRRVAYRKASASGGSVSAKPEARRSELRRICIAWIRADGAAVAQRRERAEPCDSETKGLRIGVSQK